MAHQLVISSDDGPPRIHPVRRGKTSIGRHPRNGIVLEHELVSIYHAEVIVENGKTMLRDLKSSNGTKVNGKPITEAAIEEGDEICFGPIRCHLRGEIWFKEIPDHSEKVASVKDAPRKDIPRKRTPKRRSKGRKTPKNDVSRKLSRRTAPGRIEPPAEQGRPLNFRERLLQRIAGARYFALSIFIHSVLVILAGGIVFYKTVIEPPDFVASGGDGLIISTDDLPPAPETPAEKVPDAKIVQQAPGMNAPRLDMITTAAPNSDFKIPMPEVQVKIATSAANLAKNFGTSRAFAASLPGTLTGRMGSGRARAMAVNGMKPKSEQAVMRGLAWLVEHQNDDGSWGDDNKGAMTGFALLCFLGHGELQDSPQFGITVGRALIWIYEHGTANEGRLHMAKEFTAHGVYEHAICAYALGEYYTMTRDRRVVKLLTQAIGHIIEGQGPNGGWMYAYDKSADDLSVSGWQIQALKAAHLGQLPIPGVDKALTKAVTYIERDKGPQGGYGYRDPSDDYSLTGVGILCQLFWRGDRATLRQSMTWLLDQTEKHHPVKYRERSADLYAWYYDTQACLMFGGDAWTKWNGWFQDEICDAQSADGSWPAPGGNAVGPQGADNASGAVYRTSLCVLMLEVFYRYMPTTRG